MVLEARAALPLFPPFSCGVTFPPQRPPRLPHPAAPPHAPATPPPPPPPLRSLLRLASLPRSRTSPPTTKRCSIPAPRATSPPPQVVKAAEKKILERELSGAENKEYLAMEGLPAFNKARPALRLPPPIFPAAAIPPPGPSLLCPSL